MTFWGVRQNSNDGIQWVSTKGNHYNLLLHSHDSIKIFLISHILGHGIRSVLHHLYVHFWEVFSVISTYWFLPFSVLSRHISAQTTCVFSQWDSSCTYCRISHAIVDSFLSICLQAFPNVKNKTIENWMLVSFFSGSRLFENRAVKP